MPEGPVGLIEFGAPLVMIWVIEAEAAVAPQSLLLVEIGCGRCALGVCSVHPLQGTLPLSLRCCDWRCDAVLIPLTLSLGPERARSHNQSTLQLQRMAYNALPRFSAFASIFAGTELKPFIRSN